MNSILFHFLDIIKMCGCPPIVGDIIQYYTEEGYFDNECSDVENSTILLDSDQNFIVEIINK